MHAVSYICALSYLLKRNAQKKISIFNTHKVPLSFIICNSFACRSPPETTTNVPIGQSIACPRSSQHMHQACACLLVVPVFNRAICLFACSCQIRCLQFLLRCLFEIPPPIYSPWKCGSDVILSKHLSLFYRWVTTTNAGFHAPYARRCMFDSVTDDVT